MSRPVWKRERGRRAWEGRMSWEPDDSGALPPLMGVVVASSYGFDWSAMGVAGWRVSLDDALAAASAALGVRL